ncbi:hypothetical protein C2E23DRAFT_683762, partial [Lenzites betulinus]
DLLVEGAEVSDDSAIISRQLDCRLITLVKLGFHLPLTLCTNAAIEAVQECPSLLVCKSQNDSKGTKVTVVDPSIGWPKENLLTSEEWKDAWVNFLKVLPSILAPSGVDRFRNHFEFLQGQENFSGRLGGILRFDMKIRHRYFWAKACTPFHIKSTKYLNEFNQIRTDVAAEEIRSKNNAPPRERYQPYDRNERGDRY